MMDKKIKILILGSSGMLGNALLRYLSSNPYFAIVSTTRKAPKDITERYFSLSYDTLISDLDILLSDGFDYIINAIGVIRPSDNKEDMYDSFFTNSYFPKILAKLATKYHSRLIHVSTDCVFNGKIGNYSDMSMPDEKSVYGMSKFLGEITESPHITLRTSIIGHELGTQKNLLDWFLSNSNGSTVKGYANVFWNGVTTVTLSKIIERIMYHNIMFETGLVQLGGERISKYEMLRVFQDIYHTNYIIEPISNILSDKTILNSQEAILYFNEILAPSFRDQVQELYNFYHL